MKMRILKTSKLVDKVLLKKNSNSTRRLNGNECVVIAKRDTIIGKVCNQTQLCQ